MTSVLCVCYKHMNLSDSKKENLGDEAICLITIHDISVSRILFATHVTLKKQPESINRNQAVFYLVKEGSFIVDTNKSPFALAISSILLSLRRQQSYWTVIDTHKFH